MKILHITDSHGTMKNPESRRDIYWKTFLDKLYEIGIIVKHYNIDMVIHTGDLFHVARVSDKFAGMVAERILAWGVPCYVVPGNHDMEGYSISTLDQTKLGLLATTGVVRILERDTPFIVTGKQGSEEYTVAISGQEYYADIDMGKATDFEMQQPLQDFNILCYHGYIADTPQNPNIRCTMASDVEVMTDADIILSGHYHRQFAYAGQDVDIYNPGSMMRVEQTEYNKTHKPMYGILELSLTKNGDVLYDYQFHEFRVAKPSTTVFDYTAKYKAKSHAITLDGFKNSIANTMATVTSTTSISDIIRDVCQNDGNVTKEVQDKALRMYMDTLKNAPDQFEVKQGFVEASAMKWIKSVHLKNFQSHEDTLAEFDSGLNIIVGESNNGKTSILRGIMWVVDNMPLGSDFIMAGKKDCSVRVEYSDGTYIERGRTVKDTGYYEIGYYDENNQFQTQQFRGFTNAVPVEIMNVHQMPKVNITKDIETHLNVLSQLDNPFLLTESPQVKAAAIGRITGTHILDAAVKDCNKTILGNKKLMTSYGQDLAQKQEDLKAEPDLMVMTTAQTIYHAILKRIQDMKHDNDKVAGFIQDIAETALNISHAEYDIKRLKSITTIKSVVEKASETVSKISKIETYIKGYNDITSGIIAEDIKRQQLADIISIEPIVSRALWLGGIIMSIKEYQLKLKVTEDSISGTEKSIESCQRFTQEAGRIVAFGMDKIQFTGKVGGYVQSYQNICADIEMQEKKKDGYVKIKDSVTMQMAGIKKKRTEYLLQEGVCPCCGQPITEEHTYAVTEFFGGN